jgi:hypothetical chaperone protein
MQIGLDFGTTNSGAAVFDGQVRVFPIDPHNREPEVMRSALYITREHEVLVGREAIDTYYRQNVGRPSKMVREYIGEMEITMGDVGSVKGYPTGPQTFVRDVYALTDELAPGRLLYALKSGLATDYEGTTIFGRYYELEELIALYLRTIRERVEAQAGRHVDGVVLGRPVHFVESDSEADDRRAVERLRRAAELAGFHRVAFELEPVAAARFYELNSGNPQNVVVFDLGGGTLDITVMRLGGPGERRVDATGGVGIAGDTFDRRMIEWRMLDHFGRGSTWGEDHKPFPGQYTAALTNWQAVPELNRPETLHFLRQVEISSSHPQQIRALQSFDVIRLEGEAIDVWQPITRQQFESAISAEVHRIETCLVDTLTRSGLTVGEIDAVVRTGGSAQIPRFVGMLERIFGAQRVVLSQVFTSVTAGLAIRAATDAS